MEILKQYKAAEIVLADSNPGRRRVVGFKNNYTDFEGLNQTGRGFELNCLPGGTDRRPSATIAADLRI
jgi:hypothetical protein